MRVLKVIMTKHFTFLISGKSYIFIAPLKDCNRTWSNFMPCMTNLLRKSSSSSWMTMQGQKIRKPKTELITKPTMLIITLVCRKFTCTMQTFIDLSHIYANLQYKNIWSCVYFKINFFKYKSIRYAHTICEGYLVICHYTPLPSNFHNFNK